MTTLMPSGHAGHHAGSGEALMTQAASVIVSLPSRSKRKCHSQGNPNYRTGLLQQLVPIAAHVTITI